MARTSSGDHSPESLAYLAGIIDGEGYVAFASHGVGVPKRFIIQVEMTEEPLIRHLQEKFGGAFIPRGRRYQHHKMLFRWQITGEPAKDLYRLIRPNLWIKIVDVDNPPTS